MRPDSKDRFQLLATEMELIQGIFNKYDDLIFRNRNWFVTLWAGAIGLAINSGKPFLAILAVAVAFIYWIMEGMMRYQYWYKYVVRYRTIREWLNDSQDETISVYDLTNHYGERPSFGEKVRNSFLKPEPSLLFGILCLGGIAVYLAMYFGYISE